MASTSLPPLDEELVGADPLPTVRAWLEAARADPRVHEPTAMCLATASADGLPSARMVLLKGIDDDAAFRFFTGTASRKGEELAANPRAALVLHFGPQERQVRIVGPVERLPRADAEAYAASRPRGSRIAAYVSHQSRPSPARDDLERRYREATAALEGHDVPLPEAWGGYRVVARELELWQGRGDRLHDRLVFRRDAPGAAWTRERLDP